MPKGRIFEKAVELLRGAGFSMPDELDDSRKLIVPVPEANMEFILAKPVDVPIYVEYGVTDIGIVGKDVLLEEKRDVYELLDLGIARCRMSVIGLPHWKPTTQAKVATKYPYIAAQYFREKGQQVEVIKLNGSIELAPLIGLADRIVDLIESGRTMQENGLVELEQITPITSRLIANRVSYRMKGNEIDSLVQKLEPVIMKGGNVR
jgi:ATP phosphoribosyltransferase